MATFGIVRWVTFWFLKKKTLLVFVYLTKCRVSFENKKIIKGCHNPT